MAQIEGAAPIAPAGVDTEKPSAARIYDWYLGGDQNWAVDREFGRKAEQLWPLIKPIARHNRAWMNRVVEAALDAGIRQFLDLGSGVPTVGNVHEIIKRRLPEGENATVVYVDYEPVAAAHSTLILERDEATDWAGLVQRDLRDPRAIFRDEETERLLDFDEPVCVLIVSVLHFIGPDDDPAKIVEAYKSHVVPGSWLALSHVCCEDAPEEGAADVQRFVAAYKNTSNPAWLRTRAEITPWFEGWEMVDPGLVRLHEWHPDHEATEPEIKASPFAWCGVGKKP
ncbi:SAM-dependent methyltransferase [Amycolatopsis sp.]|jgi:O-methyltransferase involved in polyketide biosynthesis|uniref:SAM-dependent methyltransferase n=1 Tax=Amycolatopsis sp. TaxID=37632 RepID=UPI002E0B68CB|nr:SAM-dependent methyltransferase [Amycolatopsis sp.]